MKPLIIFEPLSNKESLKVFIYSLILLAIFYVTVSIILALVSTKPFPEGNFFELIQFGILKAYSTFKFSDYLILILFPILGGLLFANYFFRKCGSTSGNVGIFAGVVAATCPACILPALGFASTITVISNISIYIKLVILAMLVLSLYIVASKNTCKIDS